MAPRTDHSAPEGWVMVPLNNTDLALTSSMFAVIPVKPVTTPASELTIDPILVMACAFLCASSFIVPSHENVRTAALAGKQIIAQATKSIRRMAPTHGADGFCLPKLMSSAIPDRQRPSD